MRRVHRRQRGVSLVVAIFLIVVVATLAAFAVSVGGAQRDSTNLQLLADRALAAAEAGREWGAYSALVQGICPLSQVINLNEDALRGFRVTVNCTPTAHSEPPPVGNYTVYNLQVRAQSGRYGAANYAYRRIQVQYNDSP